MKNGTMRLETPVVALLIATMFFIGLFTFIFDIAEENDVTTDLSDFETQGGKSFYNSFYTFNETKNDLDTITAGFEETTLDPTGLDIFPFLSLAFKTGIQLFKSLNIIKDILYSLGDVLGIDPIFVAIIITILLIVFIISLVMLLLGRTY